MESSCFLGNLVLLLKLRDDVIDIYRQKRETAHDYEAGHDYRDGRKRHEAMREYATYTLFYEVS